MRAQARRQSPPTVGRLWDDTRSMATSDRPPVWLLTSPPEPGFTPGGPSRRHRDGFDLPATPWDLTTRRSVAVGTITDAATAGAAMLALVRGVGLAVWIDIDGDARHDLLEDLHRAGDVQPAHDAPASADDALGRLTREERALVTELANGRSVAEAARNLGLSRRTAHRRLSDARLALGVATTAEILAIVATLS